MALSRYCLDTSAYSHFQRGAAQIVELIDTAEWLGVPSVVLGELWVGFLVGGHARQNQRELSEFLANPVVEVLAVDHEVARLYAEIVVALRADGMPLPSNDVWVAASAARAGATLLTYDPHFTAIRRIGSLVLQAPAV